MEKDIQLDTFRFFKNEPKKSISHDKISNSLFLGMVCLVLLFFYLGFNEESKTRNAEEDVIKVFTSPDVEQNLKKLNIPIVINKSKNIVNYSFKTTTTKLYGLIPPRIKFYEIEKSSNSHTLILKDQSFETIDYKLNLYKEILKDVNISEIKTFPNLKTGRMDISFKIEN